MYDYGEDKVLCMIIDDDNIMIKMPMTWNLDHHTVVSKTTIVRSCVPPWSVLYWFISVPDDPHQFVAILKFFYQFSNLPSTSLSSLATHT